MKVIVIDDEPPALESMVRMLQRSGIDVAASFANPAQALAYDLWDDVDVAFLDIDMPGMNGLELASRLQSASPELEIVFVTAYSQHAVKAFELAAADYLIKPVRAGRLEMTLERLRQTGRKPRAELPDSQPVLAFMHELGVVGNPGKTNELTWRTAKAKELFAYLVHTRDKTVSKEQLQDLLWPDLENEKAMTNLHTTVYQIRQTLKAVGLPIRIAYNGGRYRVDMPGVDVDTEIWEFSLKNALEELDDEAAFLLLTEGYRGDYLQTEGYLWAENERERLRIKWLQRSSELAGRMESVERPVDAIRLYQAIQERFPVWEPCYLGLMRSYGTLGNAGEVRNQYAKLQRTLDEELGLTPEREIEEWYERWNAGKFQF